MSLLLFDSTFTSNCADNTVFRAFGNAVHTAFANAGWIQVGNSYFPAGGTSWSDAVANATTYSYSAYETWGMNDALQSTHPVYVQVQWVASGYAGVPALSFIVHSKATGPGAGVFSTDGASSTPVVDTTARAQYALANTDANKLNSLFCGDTNRMVMALWTKSAQTIPVVFGIERTHDASGNDTSNGVLVFVLGLVTSGTTGATKFFWWHPKYGATGAEGTLPLFLPTTTAGTYASSQCGNHGVRIYPFYIGNGLILPPLLNMVSVPNTYATYGVPFSVPFYNSTHTYIPISDGNGYWNKSDVGGSQGTNAARFLLAVRWE